MEIEMDITFKDYAKIHLYDSVCEKIEEFITDNFDELEIESSRIDVIDDFEILDYNLEKILIDASFDEDDSIIYFVISAEICINQRDGHNDDYDTICKWFTAMCKGSLRNQFSSFSVLDIKEYYGIPKIKNILSDQLIPFMKKEDLDRIASDFLEKFYPESMNQKAIIPVDPILLAERLGLKIVEHQISKDNSVFGSIVFETSTIETYDNGILEEVKVDSGTIIVDPTVFYLRNIGSVNNTIVHECIHWRYHKKGFELERLYNPDINLLSCKVIGGILGKPNENLKWMEWQANSLAPRIQMPINTFKIKSSEFIRSRLKSENKEFIIDVIELVISDLAEFFGVSRQAAKIRMIDAGYEEAKGAYIYLDNRYVEPHYDHEYKLKSRETYSINYYELAIEYVRNESLRSLINTGAYVYVDSHVCINDSKYITVNLYGEYKLTEYARINMYECCLLFEITYNDSDDISKSYVTECFLCRIINQAFKYEVHFNSKEQEKQFDGAKKYAEQVSEVIKKMPIGLGEALDYLIKLSEKSIENIANLCCIDEKTIRRIKKGETNPDIRTLIAICIAMESPPPVTKYFIEKSSNRIVEYTEEGQALNLVINTCKDIYEANKMLIALEQKPLTKNLE